MATIIKEDKQDQFIIEFNNGDLGALNEIIEQWNFKDKISAIKFALAVMLQSKEASLTIKDKEGGYPRTLVPSDNLLKKETKEPGKENKEEVINE